jgi:hypothetical protein
MKKFLSSHFEMKDLGEARFVLGIETNLASSRQIERGIRTISKDIYRKGPKEI